MNKTSDERLKVMVEGYNHSAFFYKQKFQKDDRIVAWSPVLTQLKELVYAILDAFPDELEVLFKARPNPRGEDDDWIRYYGSVIKQKLLRCMRENERCIFQDGDNELRVRRLDTEEYIALDDHDVLFIYSQTQQYIDVCSKHGFEERETPLIYDAGHWHVSPSGAEENRKIIIEYLKMEEID